MKTIVCLIICGFSLVACKSKKDVNSLPVTGADTIEILSYFPVTNYIRGQVTEIRNSHVNPLKYNTTGGKTDSVWLKSEEIETAIASFLQPEIDTLNMTGLFKEDKFLDQSVDAYTFTYSPIGKLPDNMQLQHWDIYVSPKNQNVKRVYMLKNLAPNKIQQLTWQADEKWCRIVNLTTTPDGKFTIDNEQKITWNF